MSTVRHDFIPPVVVLGSVEVATRAGHHPVAPSRLTRAGDVWLTVSLVQPPAPHSSAREKAAAVAFVVADGAELPALLPTPCHLSVSFPAQVLQGVGLEGVEAVALDTGSALFWPFVTFAWACAAPAERPSGLHLYYLERLLQEMLVGVVVSSLSHEVSTVPSQMHAAALSMITARVGDPSLTAASVASELNISIRTLQRLFADHGTTVHRCIRRARVEHAVTLLEDPVYASLTIDRVAHACGLTTGSSLARAFAAEGLLPPSAVRAGARTTSH